MSRNEKILEIILSGKSDNNFRFTKLCNLLLLLGFSERTKGSHHIFFKADIEEIINL